MRYVLNSAVLTWEGTYNYRYLSTDDAKAWLAADSYVSAVAWEATADAMHIRLGVRPRVQRTHVMMNAGDEALVFRLPMRMGLAHIVDPKTIAHKAEVGLLRRIS